MSRQPKVTVIGSINMDLTVTTNVVPDQGETVLGEQFATFPGGKGANQAVAAARLGADVRLIGAVGDDVFGTDLTQHLNKEGVDTTGVHTIPGTSTGTATIIVSDSDNRIIVAPGANHELTPERIEKLREKIVDSDILLVQLEIPLLTIEKVAEIAEQSGIPLIVNPAPYQKLSASVLEKAAYLTPNESEARLLKADGAGFESKMITTIGPEGVEWIVDGHVEKVPGYPVEAVDTTGAGDTFNGALATKLAQGKTLREAASLANAAAALSVMKPGAQSGMPTDAEVAKFVEERGEAR
ncbi:ribokinase [Halobacillus fulvus]|nr:ribokinase [Halobacillus fulvus]